THSWDWITVNNTGGDNEDFNIKISTNSSWSFVSTVPGADEIRVNYSINNWTTDGAMGGIACTADYVTFAQNIPSGGFQAIQFRVDFGTSEGMDKKWFTITVQAVLS
ncbi:unnamed protein product, partial [marine sediment metagenome]